MAEPESSGALRDSFIDTISELGLEDEWEIRRPLRGYWGSRLLKAMEVVK